MSKEVLLVVESVSNEKGVQAGVIFEALELALATATKKRFDDEVELRVAINRHNGSYETFRCWTVVEEDDLENPAAQLTVEQAQERQPGAKVGDVIEEPVESIEFGRIAAQTAKQVIVQKVREAERAQVVDAYKDRAIAYEMLGQPTMAEQDKQLYRQYRHVAAVNRLENRKASARAAASVAASTTASVAKNAAKS